MKNKTRKTLAIIGLIIVLASFIYSINQVETPLMKKSIKTSVNVGKNPGFDLNSSHLSFGTVTPNGTLQREINIKNDYEKKAYAKMNSRGNITPLLFYKNKTEIEKNSTKKIPIIVKAPNKQEYKRTNKTYKGNITITLWKK